MMTFVSISPYRQDWNTLRSHKYLYLCCYYNIIISYFIDHFFNANNKVQKTLYISGYGKYFMHYFVEKTLYISGYALVSILCICNLWRQQYVVENRENSTISNFYYNDHNLATCVDITINAYNAGCALSVRRFTPVGFWTGRFAGTIAND